MAEDLTNCGSSEISEYDTVRTSRTPPQLTDNVSAPTDITVLCQDGEKVPCCRCELVHFSALLRDFTENDTKDTLSLPQITAHDLRDCLRLSSESCGNNANSLTFARSVELLRPASFLQMDLVLHKISESILQNIDHVHILSVYRLATSWFNPLAEKLWQQILSQFSVFVAEKQYLNMTEDEFARAIGDKNLSIPASEELRIVTEYLHKHPTCARIWEIGNEMVHRADQTYCDRFPSEILLTYGGWHGSYGPTNVLEVFNPRNRQWFPLGLGTATQASKTCAYYSMNVVDKKLYVCGGLNGMRYFRSTRMLHLETMEWEKLADMNENRTYVSTAAITESNGQKKILAAGGHCGIARTDSAEIYDIATNKWTRVASMAHRRSDAAAVWMDGKVFMVGGFDGRNVKNNAEFFELNNNTWYPVEARMHKPRTGVSALALTENVLMVAGGFDGYNRQATCEMLDIREGKWHMIERMTVTRSNFGFEIFNNYVYAAGGFNGASTTSSTERYDLVAQRWEAAEPLMTRRSAMQIVAIDDRDCIRRILQETAVEP